DGENPFRVQMEVVADVRQEHAEGALVELVDGVESEEHHQREERGAARDAVAPPGEPAARHLPGRDRRRGPGPPPAGARSGASSPASSAAPRAGSGPGSSTRASATRLGPTSLRRLAT